MVDFENRILTVEETAKTLRCSVGTVRNLIRAKKLPTIRFGLSERGSVRVEFETLVNDPKSGGIEQSSTPPEDIRQVRGIMVDLDPYYFREGGPLGIPASLPVDEFYQSFLQSRLQQSPFWSKAEVRNSGNGLHLIHWFEKPIGLESMTDIERFDQTC